LNVTTSPAIVSVPVRDPPGFGSAVNVVMPAPVPDAPDVMWIHDAWLAAVQLHASDDAMIPASNIPPFGYPLMVEPIVSLKLQPGAGVGPAAAPADWLNVISRPAAISVPVRGTFAFASTANVKVPFPLPVAPSITWIQPTLLTAFQLHPVAGIVVTTTGNVPPFG
jgi:hypothetical protein